MTLLERMNKMDKYTPLIAFIVIVAFPVLFSILGRRKKIFTDEYRHFLIETEYNSSVSKFYIRPMTELAEKVWNNFNYEECNDVDGEEDIERIIDRAWEAFGFSSGTVESIDE